MKKKTLNFNVITAFPDLITPHLNFLPFKKALELDFITVNLFNLKNYPVNNYGSIDDKPYGGGTGMILRIEPIFNALKNIKINNKKDRIILLSPKGKKFTQKMATAFTKMDSLTFICGRYEGVDARVEKLATDVISIGDYVVSGGELPALVIMEAVTRLIPGILEKEQASKEESFQNGLLEFPQYTRPEEFMGLKVPKILLSGDHKKIKEWRLKKSKKIA